MPIAFGQDCQSVPPHAKFYNLSTGYKGMVAQTRLAVLDNNFNVERKRACTAIGSERWHLRWSKATNSFVVKKVFEKKDYFFIQELIESTINRLKNSNSFSYNLSLQ